MPSYLRLKIPGATYFFTVNTYQRQPILTSEIARKTLRVVWNDVSQRYPFKTEAICLIPDHIHCIWRLPEGDADFSTRWSEIKRLFSAALRTPISKQISLHPELIGVRAISGSAVFGNMLFVMIPIITITSTTFTLTQ